MQNTLIRKVIIFAVIVLFISTSIATSSGINSTNHSTHTPIDRFCYSKELFNGKIAFAYVAALGPFGEGPCYFYLDAPGSIHQLSNQQSLWWLSGGAWLPDGRWLCVEYFDGALYEVDPETGDLTIIGGGGIGLLGLDWDDITDCLYGTSGDMLYEIDPEDGSQWCIGSHNTNSTIASISFDNDGTCYGIGLDTNSNLYTIDVSTGEATFLVPINNCTDAMYGAYDKDSNLFYVRGYIGIGLYLCDIDTGECTYIGPNGPYGTDISAITIPYGKPYAPVISGPQHGRVGVELVYSFYLSDPNNNPIYLWIDWGAGSPGYWLGPFTSENEIKFNHTWNQTGNFSIRAVAKDIYGALSDWSEILNVTVIENDIPNSPTITGPSNGKAEYEYTYTFSTIDPNGDCLTNFTIDWGDYNIEVVDGPFASGEKINLSHTWIYKATYMIKAKAKDIYGAESDWGILEVTIPKNYIYNWWIIWLSRFPLLQMLLGWSMW